MLDLIMKGLATWRLSHLLVEEDGPFMVFHKLRLGTGILYDGDGEVYYHPIWNPLYCIWCSSIWVGLGMLVAPGWLVKWLAYSGVAMVIESWLDNGQSTDTNAT